MAWRCGVATVRRGKDFYRASDRLRGFTNSFSEPFAASTSWRGDFLCFVGWLLHRLYSASAIEGLLHVAYSVFGLAVGRSRSICPSGDTAHTILPGRFQRNFTCKHARGTLNLHRKGRADRASAPMGLTLRACNQHFIKSSPSRTQDFTAWA